MHLPREVRGTRHPWNWRPSDCELLDICVGNGQIPLSPLPHGRVLESHLTASGRVAAWALGEGSWAETQDICPMHVALITSWMAHFLYRVTKGQGDLVTEPWKVLAALGFQLL